MRKQAEIAIASTLRNSPSTEPATKPHRVTWQDRLRQLFSLDLRSLALCRILLALLIISDLIARAPDIESHYTDRGVLPYKALITFYESANYTWTWHGSNSLLIQWLLFIAAGLAALFFLVGYRTRAAAIVSYLLMCSLHSRNPMLLSGADDVLRLMLFWCIFLPVGACYSIDHALSFMCPEEAPPAPNRSVISLATAGLIIQICLIYWLNAISKTGASWQINHSAVFYALNVGGYARPWAQFLLPHRDLLKFLTVLTLSIEAYGPCLLFLPFWNGFWRGSAVALFILFHAGLALCLTLGIFPYASAIAWLALLPVEFWNRLGRKWNTSTRQGVRIYYDNECGFCIKSVLLLRELLGLPETSLLPGQSRVSIYDEMQRLNSWVVVDIDEQHHHRFAAFLYLLTLTPLVGRFFKALQRPLLMRLGDRLYDTVARNRSTAGKLTALLHPRPVRLSLSWPMQSILAVLFGYILLFNLRQHVPLDNTLLNKSITVVGGRLGLYQTWSMFAPSPWSSHGWYVIPATLEDGTVVDLYSNGAPVSWEKPPLISATYTNDRWRSYLTILSYDSSKYQRWYYAYYLCRRWTREHSGGQRVRSLKIYYMRQNTLPNWTVSPPKQDLLWSQDCHDKNEPEI